MEGVSYIFKLLVGVGLMLFFLMVTLIIIKRVIRKD
jgi:hypothetical protein